MWRRGVHYIPVYPSTRLPVYPQSNYLYHIRGVRSYSEGEGISPMGKLCSWRKELLLQTGGNRKGSADGLRV